MTFIVADDNPIKFENIKLGQYFGMSKHLVYQKISNTSIVVITTSNVDAAYSTLESLRLTIPYCNTIDWFLYEVS